MIEIAVCDDEPLAIDALAGKIKAYMNEKGIECAVSTFLDGESLLSDIARNGNYFDAIYLDIKMNRINGIDAAKTIRKTDDKTLVVFVTALKEYVFDAFDVNAANFLVKPVDDKKLISTLDKITVLINSLAGRSLVISRSGTVKKVPFANIVYCEVLNHHIFVYESECMHEYSGKIDELEKEFPADFFRCHRSYIVNFRFVESYRDGFAHMTSEEKIPIATRRRQEFMQALLRFQLKEVR